MNYALIGCGRIAVNHIKAVLNNNLNLVAVCDLVPSHIDLLFAKTGYEGNPDRYQDFHVMLDEHPELELVAIATDSGVHAEIALACMDRGIHVIVEKPMAMSVADAEAMIAKMEEKHVKLSVCHQNRFNLAVQRMRSAVESGRFGKLSHGSVHVRWNRNLAYYEQALRKDPDNISSLNGLGYVLACQEKDLTRALSLCKQAVKSAPKSAACLDSLGWVYYKLGLYKDAMQYLQQAELLDTTNVEIAEHIKSVQLKAGH